MTFVEIISIGLAILGNILAVVFFLKSRRLRRLSYCSRNFPLITSRLTSVPGLEVSFRGQALHDLTASRILLLNTGNEILQPADFASGEPFGLSLSDEKASFLLVQVSEESRTVNAFKVVSDGPKRRSIALEFDHLGPEEGCVITILHTSTHSDDPVVQGALKGGKLVKASLARRFRPRRPMQRANHMIMWGIFLTLLAMLPAVAIHYNISVGPLYLLTPALILSATALVVYGGFMLLTAGGALEIETSLSSFGREFTWSDFRDKAAANPPLKRTPDGAA
jgi:hypothetical protein